MVLPLWGVHLEPPVTAHAPLALLAAPTHCGAPLHCVCSEPPMSRTCLAPTTSSVPAQCSRPHFLWLSSPPPPRQVMLPMGAALSLPLTQPLGLSTWYCGGICPPDLHLPVGSWKMVPDFYITSSPS